MSSQNINIQQQPTVSTQKKSVTAGFELQTKIRLIIQEVLAATIRKLSLFGQKIQKFQEYFVTFKQRFENTERERNRQQQQMNKIAQMHVSIRRDINFNEIKANQQKQRSAILYKENKDEFYQLQKTVKSLLRQNQNINAQLSKTKAKFLEYSNTISTLKQEVSWKITKYLQQTAESHTQMKVLAQGIKIQNFNMNLMIQKQKEKYDHIILKYEEDLVFRQETVQKLEQLSKENGNRLTDIVKFNTKIDDLEFSVLSKIKNSDVKFQDKLKELDKNNSKLTNLFKKIDNFNDIIDGIKGQVSENKAQFENKCEELFKKAMENTKQEVIKVMKENVKMQKAIEKKIVAAQQKAQKLQDFFLQKLQFAKMEIQSEMANKTVKMLEQKAKTEQSLSNSAVEQINSKITRIQLQNSKSINKLESSQKEQILQIKREIQKTKVDIQVQIQQTLHNFVAAAPKQQEQKHQNQQQPQQIIVQGGLGISSQKNSLINGQISSIKETLKNANHQISALQNMKTDLEKIISDFNKKTQDQFIQNEEKINTKIEKVMFLVTKMRGDSIVRNQFNQKQIKELKRSQVQSRERLQTTWKLLPGIGQCINLILAVIFDAQFQNSRIIQDNLPVLAKDAQKFNTCCEGMLYQFKEKKKQGTICYRHIQIKKTDLLRATFHGYIQIWEQIYEAEFKNKQHLLPKEFYKRVVEKAIKSGGKPTSEKEVSGFHQTQQHSSIQQMRNSTNVPESMARIESFSQMMNSSFHIRKKKTTFLKQKDEREDNLQIKQ